MNFRTRINWYTIIGTILIVCGVLLAAYPFSPLILYELRARFGEQQKPQIFTNENFVSASEDFATLPDIPDKENPYKDSPNRLIIEKIGVDMPIVEGNNQFALEKGAWRIPFTRHPDEVGNTVITGHRYKYRPPASNTLYLLNKMEIGDTFSVIWNNQEYRYGIDKKDIKNPNDFSLLEETNDRRVSIITCDPLFSTKNRLVVSGQLLKR